MGSLRPMGSERWWVLAFLLPTLAGLLLASFGSILATFALSFTDDSFAPRTAVEALHREYRAATVEHRHVAPSDCGVPRIGHFGFFKPGVPALWKEVADWLARGSFA